MVDPTLSDSGSSANTTPAFTSGVATPSTAGSSVLGVEANGEGKDHVMTQATLDGMEVDELEEDEDEEKVVQPGSRNTPRRGAAARASNHFKLPATSDLSEIEDDDIKPIRNKGKGKAKAIETDSDSEREQKADYEDDKDAFGADTDDEDIKEEVGKVRAIARALKGESNRPIAGAKAKEVGKSITRLLKGKGKASTSTTPCSSSSTSPHFEIVIPSRPHSSAAKPKIKGLTTKEVMVLSSGDESVFEPDADISEEERDELESENDGEQSVKLAMLLALGSDLDSDEDAASLGAKLEKMAKKPREKAVTRKGATLSKDTRVLMKKMTKAEQNNVKLNANHPELISCWEDLAAMPIPIPKHAEQPVGLTQKLLPFQLEGLNWMKNQESGAWGGGVLADEMGMGKTIQTIGLLLSDYKAGERNCTLVLAPTVAILQWRNEIEKFTTGFKVHVFHGSNRLDNVKALEQYDVVLTSYSVMESSFRRENKGFQRKGKLMKEDSILHKIKWHRIILDEAHNIKDRSSNTAKAAFALKSQYRWALSGTPVQNRVGELYSLVRFLGIDPFAYYFCKACDCKSLHWLCTKGPCSECKHSGMQHVSHWNDQILKPIQYGGHTATGQLAFKKLQTLLERMMLRRTKVERADDMGLPPRVVMVRKDYFTEEEEELYQSLFKNVQRKFNTFAEAGTLLNNYSNLFTLITRMRQMADHPDLVLKSTTAAPVAHAPGDAPQNIIACRICLDESEEPIQSACRHIFCRACVVMYIESCAEGQQPGCPVCNLPLTIDLEQEAMEQDTSGRQGFLARIDPSKMKTSTKIEALVEELSKLRTEDCTLKSLVFSQFTSMLDLVSRRLQLGGFKVVRLQGSMTPVARNNTIMQFTENPDITVFLISLKAGGVALNLTEASRVFILDPWWNPATELQAMDRIHRIGQHRPVVVTRLIIENSIESRILELQRKKENLAASALGDDDKAMGKLSPEDLRFLFSM